MTNEVVPRWDVKGSTIIIKNSISTELLTTTELDKFLCGLNDEGLKRFFQEIPSASSHQLQPRPSSSPLAA